MPGMPLRRWYWFSLTWGSICWDAVQYVHNEPWEWWQDYGGES